MNVQRLGSAAVVAIAGLTLLPLSLRAQDTQPETAPSSEQPSPRQVLEACVQNRAETLPNPFVDVSANHWAYKAVLTMHYCGAYRQATPPQLIERLLQQQSSSSQNILQNTLQNTSESRVKTSQTSH